ncbi:MAG: T9SS type A sorting domain-containing protein [Chitinophagales bacterium]
MKKLFTLSLALFSLILISKAQNANINIDPATVDLSVYAADYGDANSTVYNTSNAARTFRWIRSNIGAPSAWTTTVCDKNNCYSTTTSSQDFVLNAGASGLLRLTVNPNGVTGNATYQVLVYDINDSINSNTVFTVNVTAYDMTGINDPINGGVSLYPIPAKDLLNVNFDGLKNVTSIAIYNVVGQKLKTVNVYAGSKTVAIPVSDMKKGVYFIRVYSNNTEAITKTFTKE